MTAEISLLNKMAVTLAADSAVTIMTPNGPKVYNSADKIFEATNFDPIGIMIYNVPELSGVPVESIIKMYRDRTCDRHYDTVFDFAEAFLRHLENYETPKLTETQALESIIYPWAAARLEEIRQQTDLAVRSVTPAETADLSLDQFLANLEADQLTGLESAIQLLHDKPAGTWSNGLAVADVLLAHGEAIGAIIDHVFEEERLSAPVRDRLVTLGGLTLLKEYQPERLTGLVFAGFGAKEIFPSLVTYEVFGKVAGRLKFTCTHRWDVDRTLEPVAAVIPFAQREMVDRFMFGLDSQFLELCNVFFAGALDALKTRLGELLEGMPAEAVEAVDPAIDAIMDEFNEQMVPGHLGRLRQELSDMVRSMPKQELASLSESLVHITSLKRKFSAGAESVGGPIDVAVITRAEGFVWVRRKHYFDPALNPRYFSRRYGRGSEAPELAHRAPAAESQG